MPPDAQPFDWMDLLERFGVPTALVAFVCFGIYRAGQFLAPIIRGYIERKIALEEKRAEAAVVSAKAASDNAEMLAKSTEKSLEVQSENADTNRRFASALETLISRVDHLAFPAPKKRPRSKG